MKNLMTIIGREMFFAAKVVAVMGLFIYAMDVMGNTSIESLLMF